MNERGDGTKRWCEATKALVLGFVGYNVLLHQAFIRGIGAPDGASQLMMWVAVVGLVSYAAISSDLAVGLWLAAGAGLLSLAFNGIIAAGIVGPPSSGPVLGFVLGPVANALYAFLLVVVGYMAVRERGKSAAPSDTSSERMLDAQ
jgi:uncharacterized protein YqgC (DUF456 family)